MVDEALADLDAQIKAKHAELTISNTMTIEADPTLIRQLLQNLVGNALKYQQEGAIPQITIYTESTVLDPEAGAAHEPIEVCLIHVEDNGIGFDEKHLQTIFLPFQRLFKNDSYGGLGIGLATCLKIAEYHRGSISAKSMPGEGSTFTVTLPVKQPTQIL